MTAPQQDDERSSSEIVRPEITRTQARMPLTLLETRDDEYFHDAEVALRDALR